MQERQNGGKLQVKCTKYEVGRNEGKRKEDKRKKEKKEQKEQKGLGRRVILIKSEQFEEKKEEK